MGEFLTPSRTASRPQRADAARRPSAEELSERLAEPRANLGRAWSPERCTSPVPEPSRAAGPMPRGSVPLAEAAVAEGPGPRRSHLSPPEAGDRGGQPAHRVRGGQLPERRRVLGARYRHLHDPRRRLHAPLRLLQRPDGQADLVRPAGADARRDQVSRWAFATPSSRRLTATTFPTTAPAPSSGDPLNPHARPDAKSGPTPDFRGQEMPLAKVVPSTPTSSTTTSRPFPAFTRRLGGAPTSCAPPASCAWRRRWAATRLSPSRA